MKLSIYGLVLHSPKHNRLIKIFQKTIAQLALLDERFV